MLRSQPRYAAGLDKGIMPEGYLEAPLAYDAIWAIAFGELFARSITPKMRYNVKVGGNGRL